MVLVAKVMQNIANMVLPGKKEEYMKYLEGYIRDTIPKIKEFYLNISVLLDMATNW